MMVKNNSRINPILRFPSFTDNWSSFMLGKVSDVRDGTHDSPQYIIQGYPLLTSKNLTDTGKISWDDVSFISKEDFDNINKRSKVDIGDILFGMIGTLGNPVKINEDGFAIKNVALIKEGTISNDYLIHYLTTGGIYKQFHLEKAGGTQKFIALSTIRKLIIKAPKQLEQQKIASFFSLLDQKIEKQQEKIEQLELFKKGRMQKIFSQEIRFKDEDGQDFPEWEEMELKDISSPIKRTANLITPNMSILTISAGRGFLNQTERFSQVIAGSSLSKYTLLKQGEMAYNRGASKQYPFGCIYRLNLFNEALVPNIYRSFKLKHKHNPVFFEFLFSTGYANRQLREMITSTARMDGLLNINQDDFYSLRIPVPSFEEQDVVSNFLSSLNSKISIEQEKLTSLTELKKGFMQKMFI